MNKMAFLNMSQRK